MLFCWSLFSAKCHLSSAIGTTVLCGRGGDSGLERSIQGHLSRSEFAVDPAEIHTRPKIYIYDDFPREWSQCGFGDGFQYELRGAEVHINRYFHNSPYQTKDPEDADLFFGPVLFYSGGGLIDYNPGDILMLAHRLTASPMRF